jgi:hypothetical protein
MNNIPVVGEPYTVHVFIEPSFWKVLALRVHEGEWRLV